MTATEGGAEDLLAATASPPAARLRPPPDAPGGRGLDSATAPDDAQLWDYDDIAAACGRKKSLFVKAYHVRTTHLRADAVKRLGMRRSKVARMSPEDLDAEGAAAHPDDMPATTRVLPGRNGRDPRWDPAVIIPWLVKTNRLEPDGVTPKWLRRRKEDE